MRSFNTSHVQHGLAYLGGCAVVALCLWVAGLSTVVIGTSVGGIALIILVGMASGLPPGDTEAR